MIDGTFDGKPSVITKGLPFFLVKYFLGCLKRNNSFVKCLEIPNFCQNSVHSRTVRTLKRITIFECLVAKIDHNIIFFIRTLYLGHLNL